MLPKARTKGVLVQEVGDELVVYDTERKEAHRLSPSAALVWRKADGTRSLEQLSSLVGEELGVPGDEVAQLALDELSRGNLLDYGVTVQVSRRAAMRKLAAAGVAALLIPSVSSVAAPTAAMAASDVAVDCFSIPEGQNSDGDAFDDRRECLQGTDPNDPNDPPLT